MQLSADGSLAAIVVADRPAGGKPVQGRKLALVHLASGTERTFSLPPQLADKDDGAFVRWSPDGRAVLLSDDIGLHRKCFSFAAA